MGLALQVFLHEEVAQRAKTEYDCDEHAAIEGLGLA